MALNSLTTTEPPRFLKILLMMLEQEDAKMICWGDDGMEVHIKDIAEFSTKILPRYFKHDRFKSFQRQLNNYGFRRANKCKMKCCTYFHPCFLRYKPELMAKVVRNSSRASQNVKIKLNLDLTDSKPESSALEYLLSLEDNAIFKQFPIAQTFACIENPSNEVFTLLDGDDLPQLTFFNQELEELVF